MSIWVWTRGRVRVRASAILKWPKAVEYAPSGDHAVQVLVFVLRAAIATMGFKLFSFVVRLLPSHYAGPVRQLCMVADGLIRFGRDKRRLKKKEEN